MSYSALNKLARFLLTPWAYNHLIGRWDISGLKRYFHNVFWALSTRVFNTITSFFVTIYLVRYLGPENYGQLSYALSFIGLFTIISTLGIENILYRDLVKYPEQRTAYLGTALVIRICAGAAAALLAATLGWLTNPDDVSKLAIILLSATFLFTPFNIIFTEFQANVAQKYPSLVITVVVLILNIMKIGVIFSGEGILYVALILLLEPILYAIFLSYIRVKYYGSFSSWRFDRKIARQMLIDAWPFILIAIFMTVYTRIDQVMLKHLIDSTAVGIYDAAVRAAEAWLFLPAIVVSSVFPAIVNAKQKLGVIEYRYRLLALTSSLMAATIALALPLSLFAKPIIHMLYGPDFAESAVVFAIYMWVSVFIVADIVLRNFLIVENRRRTIFFMTASVAVINTTLNFLLIPIMGISGAALSTLIAYIIFLLPLGMIWKLRGST